MATLAVMLVGLTSLTLASGFAVNRPMLHRGFLCGGNCGEANSRAVAVGPDDDLDDVLAVPDDRGGYPFPFAYNFPVANEVFYDRMRPREGRASSFPRQHPALAAVDARRPRHRSEHRADFHPNVRLISYSDMGGGFGAGPSYDRGYDRDYDRGYDGWVQEPRVVYDSRIRDPKNKPLSAGRLIQILKSV